MGVLVVRAGLGEKTMASTKDEDRERAEAVAGAKGRDNEPVGELRDLKDAAEAAAAKARGLLLCGAVDDRRPPYAEEPAGSRKLEEMGHRASGQHVEAQRGAAGKHNIMSSIGSLTGAIKEKMTQPTDVVNEIRLGCDHRGAANRGDPTETSGHEHIPPGDG